LSCSDVIKKVIELDDYLFSQRETARLLRVGDPKLKQIVKDGLLPCIRRPYGNEFINRYRQSDIKNYLDSQTKIWNEDYGKN